MSANINRLFFFNVPIITEGPIEINVNPVNRFIIADGNPEI